MSKTDTKEFPVLSFKTPKAFERWLAKNHDKVPGIWLRFFKKASEEKSINYKEALDEALCYGWIDAIAKPWDEQSWIQKFMPRRPKSIWSKRNRDHVARLTEEGRMKPPGIKEVEKAKADGRWEQAYDSLSKMKVPDDFLQLLSKNKKAFAFFQSLNKTNQFAVAFRLQTAKKPETREKRMKLILQMMKEGKKFH